MTTITPATATVTNAAVATVTRRIPWAGIATVTNEIPGTYSLPILQNGGLDWDVAIRPLYRTMKDGTVVQSDRDWEVYRDDTEYQVGTVRTKYQPHQNRDSFAFGDVLVADGNGMWVAAGQQYGGSRVLMVMQLSDEFDIIGDPHRMFLIFRTSHDGSTAIRADAVPFRLKSFTNNHLVITGVPSTWKVRHVSTLEARMEEAALSLSMAAEYRDAYIEQATKLASVPVQLEAGKKIINAMIKKDRTRRDEVIEDLVFNWVNTSTVPDEWRWTGLGLLNATTEYFGHIARRQGDGNSLYESVMTGEAADARKILARMLKIG